MSFPESLVEDLKGYINWREDENLEIDVNKASDAVLDEDESAFSEEYVRDNLSGCFEWLESGSTRHVYKICTSRYGSEYNGKVIKFARTPKMRKFNSLEIETWMAVRSRALGSYFCPIRLFDKRNGSWLIMDYADPCLSSSDARVIEGEVREWIDKKSFDIHYNNIGMHPDRGRVLIDYSWGGDLDFKK